MTKEVSTSRFPALLKLLALTGALAAVTGGVSGAFASDAEDLRTVQQKLEECREKTLKLARADVNFASGLLAKAKRGALVLLRTPDGDFYPVGVEEAEFWINLRLRAGTLTPKQAVEYLREIGKAKAATVQSLTAILKDEEDILKRAEQECAKLAAERDRLLKAGGDGGGSFVLASTKVTNPNAPELKIDATGGTATWDHCCSGGGWKVEYTFKVPRTLSPGQSFPVTLGLKAGNVRPVQPLNFSMGASAPDFNQALTISYPDSAQAEKTFTVPISAGYKDFKDIVIVIGIVSAQVVYTYNRKP
ncbi:MAG TPA: hypothetical protein VGB42_00135 [Candidatus Thermoplasmatota archaeon]